MAYRQQLIQGIARKKVGRPRLGQQASPIPQRVLGFDPLTLNQRPVLPRKPRGLRY